MGHKIISNYVNFILFGKRDISRKSGKSVWSRLVYGSPVAPVWPVVCHSVLFPAGPLQDCERYVEQLLELFEKFSALVRDAFHNDPRFLTSRDKAFKDLVNDTSVFK